jgi:hypothetical protein
MARPILPFLALLPLLPLGAGEALRVAAVERKGWPPFEDDRRVYRIEGEGVAALRVGEKLRLQHPGVPGDPGVLKVALVAPGFAEANLERRGRDYPLKGDLAEPARARALPPIPGLRPEVDLRPAQPRLQPPSDAPQPQPLPAPAPVHAAPKVDAPPTKAEPIFFLEGDGALSPKGVEKLRRLVEAWGVQGAWSLGVPEDRALPARVREARVQALRRALRSLGVATLEVRAAEVRAGDRGDVVYAGKR